MKKLTWPQKRSLEDIRDSGDPWRRVFGQSAHGGMHKVMLSITRNGWAKQLPSGDWSLTESGKTALASAKE